jgi:uncharacterized protein (DUF934 family)
MNMLEIRPQIIYQQAVVSNDWALWRLESDQDPASIDIPEYPKLIVPLAVFQAQRASLLARPQLGVCLPSDARPEVLQADMAQFQVIAIDFPKFTDGRGYSIAWNLRSRLHFSGQLRAIGDVLRDQLFYMQRVGFDAYEPRADKDIHDALKGLSAFSEVYQHSLDQKLPLFKRVSRSSTMPSSLTGCETSL